MSAAHATSTCPPPRRQPKDFELSLCRDGVKQQEFGADQARVLPVRRNVQSDPELGAANCESVLAEGLIGQS